MTESPKGPRRDAITPGKVAILLPRGAERLLRAADAKSHSSGSCRQLRQGPLVRLKRKPVLGAPVSEKSLFFCGSIQLESCFESPSTRVIPPGASFELKLRVSSPFHIYRLLCYIEDGDTTNHLPVRHARKRPCEFFSNSFCNHVHGVVLGVFVGSKGDPNYGDPLMGYAELNPGKQFPLLVGMGCALVAGMLCSWVG